MQSYFSPSTLRTVMLCVSQSAPAFARATASSAVLGTGIFERLFHHDSAFFRAQPVCSKQIHSDW